MEGDIRPKINALIIGVNLYTEMVAVGGHVTIIVNRVYKEPFWTFYNQDIQLDIITYRMQEELEAL